MEIYQPAEDSYLSAETLERYLSLIINSKKINKKLSNRSSDNLESLKNIININYTKNIRILDMGSGSGIQAQTCKRLGFNNLLAADINKEAVKYLKKQKIKAIYSDLFSNIKGKFDLIIFNPPYLPEDKYDKKPDTTAGKQGNELIIEFLNQARSHLNKKGAILLLFSSLSQPNTIKKKAKELNYKIKLLNKKKLFFEELFVYELKK